MPRSKANIDHIVVSPKGIFVIDAKRYAGQVRQVDRGGWFKTDIHLYVGRRDCTKLLAGMARQVKAVAVALQHAGLTSVPIWGHLCFVDAEWGLFARPFEVEGVWIGWPKALAKRPATENSEGVEVTAVATALRAGLRPAG
jgi:hypothetical protein